MGKKEIRSGAFSSLFSFIRKRMLWVMILLVVLLLPSLSSSEEYKNIGFKKDVSKELKQKFPMCDEFLDVKWIDAKRYIGKLKAEMFYRRSKPGIDYGKKLPVDETHFPEEKGEFTFLVFSKQPGTYGEITTQDYATYVLSEDEYKSKKFDEFIKDADISSTGYYLHAYAKHGKKRFETTEDHMPFHPRGDPYYTMTSYAHFTKNICLLDPEEKNAVWIEDKKPFQDENLTGELKEKYENIQKMATENCNKAIKTKEIAQKCIDIDRGKYKDTCNKPETYMCDMKPVKYGTSIDLNFDGTEEYMSSYVINIDTGGGKKRVLTGKGFIIFSKNGKLELVNLCGPFYFKEKERAFYSGNCNLTELTKGGK